MQRLIGIGLLGLATFVFLGAAEGQDQKKKKKGAGFLDAEASFKKLDANSDGKLSKDEYLKAAERVTDAEKAAKFRAGLEKSFEKFSSGGSMSLDQYKEARKAMFEAFKKKKENN